MLAMAPSSRPALADVCYRCSKEKNPGRILPHQRNGAICDPTRALPISETLCDLLAGLHSTCHSWSPKRFNLPYQSLIFSLLSSLTTYIHKATTDITSLKIYEELETWCHTQSRVILLLEVVSGSYRREIRGGSLLMYIYEGAEEGRRFWISRSWCVRLWETAVSCLKCFPPPLYLLQTNCFHLLVLLCFRPFTSRLFHALTF